MTLTNVAGPARGVCSWPGPAPITCPSSGQRALPSVLIVTGRHHDALTPVSCELKRGTWLSGTAGAQSAAACRAHSRCSVRHAWAISELCVQTHGVRAEEAEGQGCGLPLQGPVPRWKELGWALVSLGSVQGPGQAHLHGCDAEQRGAGWRWSRWREPGAKGRASRAGPCQVLSL